HTPDLADRVWFASSSPSGAEFAARYRIGLISGRKSPDPAAVHEADAQAADTIRTYRTAIDVSPRVAVSRPVMPGIDSTELTERQRSTTYCGPASTVLERLQQDPELAVADEVICHSQPLALPPDRELDMLRRIAHDIAPALPTRSPAH